MVERISTTLTELYPEPNTLRPFATEIQDYHFLSDRQVVELASQVCDKITESHYRKVLFAETGSSPFAEICDLLLRKKQHSVEWCGIKVPREQHELSSQSLLHLLTEEERAALLSEDTVEVLKKDLETVSADEQFVLSLPMMTREEVLRKICSLVPKDQVKDDLLSLPNLLSKLPSNFTSVYHHMITHAVEGSEFSRFIKDAFFYFDEYVDSGKTLQQTDRYVSFFSEHPQYKILAYYMFVSKPKEFPIVYYSLFSHDTRQECYQRGAYPFENRVDLIGHFYTMSDTFFKRVSLEDISKNEPLDEDDTGILLDKLTKLMGEENMYETVISNLTNDNVKGFIEPDHIIRFLLYKLEKETHGESEFSQFLWQCFDMYGPCWSPLPDSYHLDYWNGFDQLDQSLSREKLTPILAMYEKSRLSIITAIAKEFQKRRTNWQRQIESLIEEEYAN